MSQEKVDRNKEAKKNIRRTLKRNRRKRIAGIVTSLVLLLALLSGGTYLGIQKYNAYKADHIKSETVDLSAIEDYLSGVTAQ